MTSGVIVGYSEVEWPEDWLNSKPVKKEEKCKNIFFELFQSIFNLYNRSIFMNDSDSNCTMNYNESHVFIL